MSTLVQGRLKQPSLRANISWTFVGNSVYVGCQWGILVVLARLGSPELVGLFALAIAVTAPVMMLASLGLREVQATDARHEYGFGDYLSLRLLTTASALLLVSGIVVVAAYDAAAAGAVMVVGLAKGCESIGDVFHGLFQQRERMDCVARSLLLKGPLSLLAIGLGVYATGSVMWAVLAMAAVWTTVLIGYDCRTGWRMLDRPMRSAPSLILSRYRLARLAWLALPLGIVLLLSSILVNTPRYFIAHHLGESALGLYAVLISFDRAGSLIVHAIGRSTSPRLSQYYLAQDPAKFAALLLKIAGTGLILGAGAVMVAALAGRFILALFYGPHYARPDLFVWLMVSAGMSYTSTLLIYGLTAARALRSQMLLYVVATGLLALLCWAWIPTHGLRGAVNALVAVRAVELGGASAIMAAVVLALAREARRGQRKRLEP